jgi:hypothetical protein
MDNSIKKYLKSISLVVLLSFQNLVFSQNIISDIGGSGSILLNPGFKETKKDDVENKPKVEEVSFNLGIIKFTSSDKKMELNHYNYFHTEKFTDFFVGISGSGEIKNNLTNLFSTGKVVAGAEANLKLGVRLFRNKTSWIELLDGKKTADEIQEVLDYKTRPASDLWFIASGNFNGSSFKHFQTDSAFSKQIEKKNFMGSEINAGFNYWNARILNSTFIVGATIGMKRTNNFDDLNENTQEDTQVITDSITGAIRKVVSKQTVYSGNYKESTVYPFNVDLYFAPHNLENLAFLLYSRTDISRSDKPKTKMGFGLFFLKNQNVFNPLAGLTIDYGDVFNVDPSDDSKGAFSKIKIGITTRINIVNSRSRK